ncbi:hypothetical protein QJS10_CPB13g00423 [Acorus calamus]|uniref:Prolyl 4-hydroxylase alpha subunit domain-containing protein n=1 Tax=Acorus calamus TaxID=4465 RepID=A0AAV9DL24_ACOCL|nr:hypothetical protein QJS10_CPB13g00423 [Acorus calamus]
MKGKGRGGWGAGAKLGLPAVLFFCSLFFLVGFFGSVLLSQDISGGGETTRRLAESVNGDVEEILGMDYGETGEDLVSSIPFQVLSMRPRAVYFPKFATPEQCQGIIKMTKPNLRPSTLALRKGETVENTKGIRTSSGTFISASEDKTGILANVERKIARVTMIPRAHGEAFNVLRYEIGQSYYSHYDAFNPAEYGPQKNQRNGLNMDGLYDYKECIGLKVKPRQGDGLLFYSAFPNGTIDATSLHGSCPVIKGKKWVATKWLRDQEIDKE